MGLWKKVALVAITGDGLTPGDPWSGGPWRIDSLGIPTPHTGYHAWWWNNGNALSFPLVGADAWRLVTAHDAVILYHYPPPAFVAQLKDAGVREVYLWTDYEATLAQGYWSPYQRSMRDALESHLLAGTQLNSRGSPYVDVYENVAGRSSFAVDVSEVSARAFAPTVAQAFAPYAGLADGVCMDSVMARPYYGSATNAPPIDEARVLRYQRGWSTFLTDLASRLAGGASIWGNCNAANTLYPQLDCKLGEMDLAGTVDAEQVITTVMKGIDDGENQRPRRKRQRYIFYPVPYSMGWSWPNSPERWEHMQRHTDGRYDDNIMVCTFGSPAFLFHPGGKVCKL